jgi:hypothetical protein
MGNKPSGENYKGQPPLDLAGSWLPIRHSEWKNRNIGKKHSERAAMPKTKVTYKETGSGEGWVGDLYVYYKVMCLAPGQYSAKAKIPILLWEAKDGNLTVLDDGTLEVRYPSNGIVEYWRRGDGVNQLAVLSSSRSSWNDNRKAQQAEPSRSSRSIKIVFRKAGYLGIAWHWGIAIGDSIYEVGGSMAVLGPRGVVRATGPVVSSARSGTKLSQFKGYVQNIEGTTYASHSTDEEIEDFVKVWVTKHPMYNPAGPNCQTFTEDLFVFLTGKNLPFAKFADLSRGPEASADTVWI